MAVEGQARHDGEDAPARLCLARDVQKAIWLRKGLLHAKGAALEAVEVVDAIPLHETSVGHHTGDGNNLASHPRLTYEPACVHLLAYRKVDEDDLGALPLGQREDAGGDAGIGTLSRLGAKVLARLPEPLAKLLLARGDFLVLHVPPPGPNSHRGELTPPRSMRHREGGAPSCCNAGKGKSVWHKNPAS